MPVQRDGTCLAVVTPKVLQVEEVKSRESTNEHERTGGSPEKHTRMLVLMGGDRFQRPLNDTFIMPI